MVIGKLLRDSREANVFPETNSLLRVMVIGDFFRGIKCLRIKNSQDIRQFVHEHPDINFLSRSVCMGKCSVEERTIFKSKLSIRKAFYRSFLRNLFLRKKNRQRKLTNKGEQFFSEMNGSCFIHNIHRG